MEVVLHAAKMLQNRASGASPRVFVAFWSGKVQVPMAAPQGWQRF
jgi:hypothetical protein